MRFFFQFLGKRIIALLIMTLNFFQFSIAQLTFGRFWNTGIHIRYFWCRVQHIPESYGRYVNVYSMVYLWLSVFFFLAAFICLFIWKAVQCWSAFLWSLWLNWMNESMNGTIDARTERMNDYQRWFFVALFVASSDV